MYQVRIPIIIHLASKERSHLLLRDPDENKIPRKVKEKLDQKDQELDEADMTIHTLKNEINELSNKIKRKSEEIKEGSNYADMLNELSHRGIINENGNIIENDKI